MADEQPPKKVVKRVVKRPVAASEQPAKPQMRYGRPVSGPPTKVAARDTPAPAPPTTPASPKLKTPGAKAPLIKRPSVKAPSVDVAPALDAVRDRTSRAASAVGRAGRAVGDFAAGRWRATRAWRIPALEPVRATLLTGLLVGLVSVGLAVGALALFSAVRGVANGGPLWGSLTFVVVTVVAFVLGERLLTAFGTPMPRLTSLLGVVLTLITILSVFLGLADSRYGIVIVPIVSAAALWLSHWVLTVAESSPVDAE